MNKNKIFAIVASYARAAVASVLAMYLAGNSDAKALGLAFLAAFAGPLLKALSPNEKQFGIGATRTITL